MVVSSPKDEHLLALELLKNGVPVEIEKPGRKRFPEAGLLVAMVHLPRGTAERLQRNAALRQLDAVKNRWKKADSL